MAIRHTGRVGHQFQAGAHDLVQLWIEGEVTSGAAPLVRWGEATPGGPLLRGTPVFRRGGLTRGPSGPEELSHPWVLQGVPFPVLRPLRDLRLVRPALQREPQRSRRGWSTWSDGTPVKELRVGTGPWSLMSTDVPVRP